MDYSEGAVNMSFVQTPTTCPLSLRLLSLRAWQIRNKITSKAMQDLLKIAPSMGLNDLPLDWRSVIRLEKRLQQSTVEVSEVVEVCSNCFLHRFSPEVISTTQTCSFCSYARLFCPRCHYRCILASSIGNKSKKYIAHCMACGANSGVKVTIRSYIFNIAQHLVNLFGDQEKAMSLLQPFQNEHEKLFSLTCPVTGHPSESSEHATFQECDDWLEKWRAMCKSSKFFKELWHGERFYNHSLFKDHGMRSVLFEVSLDWFPPHKDKQKYSVGVLSCAPANFTLHQRSDMSNIFVLAVIEGPSEPVHTLALLQPVFKNFATIDANGLKVFDSLTNKTITVHATVGLCVCDTPATSKLGAFLGHSAYMPCFRCCYKACLCGCKFNTADGSFKRCTWNNVMLVNPASTSVPPLLHPGSRDDQKKKKGEHMAFTDNMLVSMEQLRKDADVRRDQIQIGLFMWTPGHVKAQYSRMKKELRSTCVSPILIIPSSRFDVVLDHCIDGMHNVFKGIVQRLIDLTFDAKYEKISFNLNKTAGHMTQFADRMRRFRWGTRDSAPQRLHKSTGGLKAAEIWFFVRVQCLIVLRELLPTQAFIVWTLATKLVSAIMHTHVSKAWMLNNDGVCLQRLLKTFYERFHACYGSCHMPYNFHMLLHSRVDCVNWSSLRSHSTFKFERLYHELIGAPRSNGSNKVTQSIVRAASELHVRFSSKSTISRSIPIEIDWPATLPAIPTITCLNRVIDGQSFKCVKTCEGLFGGCWKMGDLVTVIDHSSGVPVYVGGSLACTIEMIFVIKAQYVALLYPVKGPPIPSRLPLGCFRIGNHGPLNPGKFVCVNFTKVPESFHICHVARYDDPTGLKLFVPLCGPMPIDE